MEEGEGNFAYGDKHCPRNSVVSINLNAGNGQKMVLLFRDMVNQAMDAFNRQLTWKNVGHGSVQNFPTSNLFGPDGSMIYCTTEEYVTSRENIRDGIGSFVYRVYIYNNRLYRLAKMGSIDGCHRTFLVIAARERPTHGCIRRLWLKPPGVYSFYLMWSMVEELRKRRVDVVTVKDDHGDVHIFLDLVGYAGYYYAVIDITDGILHNCSEKYHL